jgi:hypothetical protein
MKFWQKKEFVIPQVLRIVKPVIWKVNFDVVCHIERPKKKGNLSNEMKVDLSKRSTGYTSSEAHSGRIKVYSNWLP